MEIMLYKHSNGFDMNEFSFKNLNDTGIVKINESSIFLSTLRLLLYMYNV